MGCFLTEDENAQQAGTKDSKTEGAKARRHDVGSSREEAARKKLKQGHDISSPVVSISINPTRASSPAPGITSATDRTSSSKRSSAAEEDLSLPRPIPLTKAALVLLPGPATGSSPVSSRTGSPQPLAGPSEERSSKSSLDAEAASTGSKGDLSGLAGPTKRSSASNPSALNVYGKKAKEEQQLSYFDLAVDIVNRLSEVVSSRFQVLRGVTIFMITSELPEKPVADRTRIRLELVMKHGGKVQPAFDPSTCTHVICDLPKGQTGTKETIKRCLGGRAVDNIPHEILIVGWDWVTNSINGGALQDQLKAEQYVIEESLSREALKAKNGLDEVHDASRPSSTRDFDDIPDRQDPQDGRTHKGVLSRLLRTLSEKGVITHALAEPDFSTDGLEAKFLGPCRLNATSRRRRIDILTVSYHQWGAALLYFTGDDIFNRSMRLLARHKGFSLNQRGLWAGATRDPETGEKVTEGSLVASRTEEEIFKVLGVPW
ncbi:hypothetical protein FRC04_002565 [Tulasnella sp. 424]|nr:hypothetical protein FRC04_002565 [Tulasnella sp. 424]